MTDPVLDAIRQTLDRDPKNGALWLHYGELLDKAGRLDDALAALRTAAELDDSREQAARAIVPLLRRAGLLSEALIRAEKLLADGDDPALREELALIHEARGAGDEAAEQRELAGDEPPPGEPQAMEVSPTGTDPDDWVSQFDWGDLRVTLADVAGLEEVKRQIRLRIIAPFQQPEVYEAFGREGGGGILMYGPPGCGKTYVARATAGELGARFVSVSIHEVIDKYFGESEKMVHALFEDARKNSPTVLFFDEFDAMGFGARQDRVAVLEDADRLAPPGDGRGRGQEPRRPALRRHELALVGRLGLSPARALRPGPLGAAAGLRGPHSHPGAGGEEAPRRRRGRRRGHRAEDRALHGRGTSSTCANGPPRTRSSARSRAERYTR